VVLPLFPVISITASFIGEPSGPRTLPDIEPPLPSEITKRLSIPFHFHISNNRLNKTRGLRPDRVIANMKISNLNSPSFVVLVFFSFPPSFGAMVTVAPSTGRFVSVAITFPERE